MALLERIKKYVEHEGKGALYIRIGIILVVFIAVTNLAFSQVHIRVIMQMFNRIVGLVMFSFILFGLVSLFAVTRINNTRSSILWAVVSVVVTMCFGVLFLMLQLNDVDTQVAINFSTVAQSFIVTSTMLLGYALAIVSLLIGELHYGQQ